ncbi:MAG: hypothetical protein OXI30_19540 [Chloroflexota bacterium]|nr:hypothetical protein [Chloroflexota bacterium]
MRNVVMFLLIVIVVLLVLVGVFATLFLRSLFVLQAKTPIAEVLMSPIQADDKGEYIDIEYTPILHPTGLQAVLDVEAEATVRRLGEAQSLRVYGDTVGVEGPFIKLHDWLLLLPFKNFFKVSLLEGEYRLESNLAAGEGSEFPIDGGYDVSWWDFNANEGKPPNNFFVERFTFASALEPGFRGSGQKRYEIVATFDTLTWQHLADIGG